MTKLNLIIGNPVEHSLSPLMHNQGYQEAGLEREYKFEKRLIETEDDLKDFLDNFRNNQEMNGLSVTIPYKEVVIPFLDELDLEAEIIGAVNTVVKKGSKLIGYNTDWQGVLKPLLKILNRSNLKGLEISVIGAGGSSKATVMALLLAGGNVSIFNRTLPKAEKLVSHFKSWLEEFSYSNICLDSIQESYQNLVNSLKIKPKKNIFENLQSIKAFQLEKIQFVQKSDIIINTTSVGLYPNSNKSLVPKEFLSSNQIVFDIVYKPLQTKLLEEAKEVGARTINGLEMLSSQAQKQFWLQTGEELSTNFFEKVLKEYQEKNL